VARAGVLERLAAAAAAGLPCREWRRNFQPFLADSKAEATVIAPSPTDRISRLFVLLALALACATSKEQKSAQLPSFHDTRTETATAVVQAVDLQTREVTVKGEDGRPFTFVAGEEVQNLPQVQVGDTVKVTYTESLAIDVKREEGSTAGTATSAEAERALPGQKPGGSLARTITASAEIVAIDRASNRVTLKGPKGNFQVIEVKDPKKLENVQVGDMVHATYTESVGVAVERVPPAPVQ
jgi:Cu/Ag efflux protein CusF